MNLRAAYQKLVTKVTDLENEKADIHSELEQLKLLAKYKKTDFVKEREELQAEITELQMLVEDLRTQVSNEKLCVTKEVGPWRVCNLCTAELVKGKREQGGALSFTRALLHSLTHTILLLHFEVTFACVGSGVVALWCRNTHGLLTKREVKLAGY